MPLFQPNLFQTGRLSTTAGPTDLAALMDALGAATPVDATTHVYPWPVESIVPPAIVVGYPTAIDYDVTFQRGSDHLTIPVYFICGRVADLAARDEVSGVIGGAHEIKDAIENDATVLTRCQTLQVKEASVVYYAVGAVTYIAVRFDVEVWT